MKELLISELSKKVKPSAYDLKERALYSLGFSEDDMPKFDCWCCEYAIQQSCEHIPCDFCPIQWGSNDYNTCKREEYSEFACALEKCYDLEKAAALAHKIANLPEKSKDHERLICLAHKIATLPEREGV